MNIRQRGLTDKEFDYLAETKIPLNEQGSGIVLLIDRDIEEITDKTRELFGKLDNLAIVEFYERGIINLKAFKEMNRVYQELINGSK